MVKLKKVPTTLIRHVVDFEDNRQEPNPFGVMLRPMSGAEYLAAQRLFQSAGEGSDEVRSWNEAAIMNHVAEVFGDVTDDNGEIITSAKGLLRSLRSAPGLAYQGIVLDIVGRLLKESKLSEDQEKKHDSQRPSSSAVTSPSNGTAADANHGSLTTGAESRAGS